MIPIDEIKIKERARKDLGSLDLLEASIKDKGLLQPITVRPLMEGGYKLLAGRRRLQACTNLGLSRIHCVVRQTDTGDDQDDLEIELLENIAREDFAWHERVDLTYRINQTMRAKGSKPGKDGVAKAWTASDTAKLIGRSRGGVVRQLQLYDMMQLVPEMRQMPNEDVAVQLARKLIEKAELQKVSKRQEEAKSIEAEEEEEFDPADAQRYLMLQYKKLIEKADANYRIQNAFDGLQEIVDLRAQGINPPINICEVDPPYSIRLLETKKGDSRNKEHYTEIPQEEYPAFIRKLCGLLYQALGTNAAVIFWFGQEWYQLILDELTIAGFKCDPIPCIWTKKAGQTASPDTYLARGYESFIHARKGDPLIINRGRLNIFDYNPLPPGSKRHPTERPIELMLEILSTFSMPHSILLVPFLGSGVSLLAAYRLNMNAFGFELSPPFKQDFMKALDDEFNNFYASSILKEITGEVNPPSEQG